MPKIARDNFVAVVDTVIGPYCDNNGLCGPLHSEALQSRRGGGSFNKIVDLTLLIALGNILRHTTFPQTQWINSYRQPEFWLKRLELHILNEWMSSPCQARIVMGKGRKQNEFIAYPTLLAVRAVTTLIGRYVRLKPMIIRYFMPYARYVRPPGGLLVQSYTSKF